MDDQVLLIGTICIDVTPELLRKENKGIVLGVRRAAEVHNFSA